MPTRYVLDSNIFITAARQHYPFDLVPSFWTCLEQHAATGRVQSIDRVQDELVHGKDELATWVAGPFAGAFKATNGAATIAEFRAAMAWAGTQKQLMPAAVAEFAKCADGWLVAYAKAEALTVVTHETFAPDCRNRVKIPNVCKHFGVTYVGTLEMLRGLGAKLS
jgi:hypothetical protein